MKNYTNILKLGYVLVIIAALTILNSCSKDDGPDPHTILPPPIVEVETIFGKWEVTSGRLLINNSKFVHINEDNTIYVLSEDTMGFKGEKITNISVTENQLTVSGRFSSEINNYTVSDNKLTITLPRDQGEVKLERNNNIPQRVNWVKALTILDEGITPWEGYVDIAFNGTHILYGVENGGNQIGLINPNTFNLDDTISTAKIAKVVEIEKYNSPDRYFFQGGWDFSAKFEAFREDDNSLAFESIDTGYAIYGLASVNETQIWVSSAASDALYLYQYGTTHEIVSRVNLEFSAYGLDYQDGYLYVSDGFAIHKCETTPTLRAVESYRIENHTPYGIAYDGSNFWLNTKSSEEYKLIKINLSI